LPALADVVASLEHPGARRRFGVGPGPEGDGWRSFASACTPAAVADRAAADPVARLGIDELSGAMAFHGPAAGLVDLVVSALVVRGVGLLIDAEQVAVRFEGPSVVAARVAVAALVAGPRAAPVVAGSLVGALGPLVAAVAPHDEALRWGAVADLVAVVAAGRCRAQGLDAEATWAVADAVVAALRELRPHPAAGPARLAVEGPDGRPLALARRSTCCQWYRAARHLGKDSVADARCADCPSLDPATNAARLAALARSGDLAVP
jgi:hypothetical protein